MLSHTALMATHFKEAAEQLIMFNPTLHGKFWASVTSQEQDEVLAALNETSMILDRLAPHAPLSDEANRAILKNADHMAEKSARVLSDEQLRQLLPTPLLQPDHIKTLEENHASALAGICARLAKSPA